MFSRYDYCGFTGLARYGVAFKSSGGTGTQTVQSNSTSGPPQWAQMAGQQLFGGSQTVADNLAPTSIAQVAPLTAGQTSLIGQMDGNVGAQNGNYGQAISTLNGLQGFGAPTITAGQLSGTDLSPYMNPYTKNVIDTTNAVANQSLKQAINQTDDASRGSGAFGGSRQGVMEGVTNAQGALGMAQTNAQLQDANFGQARGAAAADIANKLAADTTNAGNAISSAGLRENAANSAVSAAGQQQQTYLNSLFAALTGEGMIQNQNQQQNQYQADVANANNMAPVQRLQLQQSMLNGIPLATETSGTQTVQTQQPGSTLGQILGGGLGVAGSLAGILGSGGFGLIGPAAKAIG